MGLEMERKSGVRERNGRLSRRKEHKEERDWETERKTLSVALEARQRVFGLTEEQAKDPFGGTLLGRMCQRGEITIPQMDAANRYIEVRTDFQRAHGIKPWHNQSRPEGEGTLTYEDFCEASKTRHQKMEEVIAEVCAEERCQLPRMALEHIVFRDVQMPHLNGYLRGVLNRLHAHFFAVRAKAA